MVRLARTIEGGTPARKGALGASEPEREKLRTKRQPHRRMWDGNAWFSLRTPALWEFITQFNSMRGRGTRGLHPKTGWDVGDTPHLDFGSEAAAF